MVETRVIAAYIYPGCAALDVVGPFEALNLANLEYGRGNIVPYELRCVGLKEGPIRTLSGLTISAKAALGETDPIDTIIVPGLVSDSPISSLSEHCGQLKESAPRAARLASVCSGLYLCAEAGLFDHRKATTHWKDCENIARAYPQIEVLPDRIFIKDGNRYSSGGLTAGIDLALQIIEEDLGREISLKVAKRLVVFFKRQGGQNQFSEALMAQASSNRMGRILDWIEDNLSKPINHTDLAERAAMSPRNFSRHFKSETGYSPMSYVERRRTERARILIEGGHSDLAKVAALAGFGTGDAMRRAFTKHLSVLPQDHLKRFGAAQK
ncbi:MAG: GlxA family transcriptional regulator [Altererythrobacter ishigakiensis]|nr:GlxA family transcriptional regulator [Altererythrobacter ishigakiensis]